MTYLFCILEDATFQPWTDWQMCEKTCYKCRGPEGGRGCRIKATQSRSRTCSAAANNGKTCPSETNFWEKYTEEKLCDIPKCACMYTVLYTVQGRN
mgnify:CR=1 FL=1